MLHSDTLYGHIHYMYPVGGLAISMLTAYISYIHNLSLEYHNSIECDIYCGTGCVSGISNNSIHVHVLT